MKTATVLLPPLVLIALAAGAAAQKDDPGRTLSFDRYHDSGQTSKILTALAGRHPDLLKLEVIGKSGQKKEIQVAVVTDHGAGRPEEKPGIFVDGNIHGNERIGGEAALYLIHALLTRRQEDALVDELLRTRTFYVIPKANPDAADAWVRGILKPEDQDGDGKEDEDGPEDVDGNGLVTSMRIADPEGNFVPDLEDARLMVRYDSLSVKERKRYRGLRYRVLTEGIDNDDDGEVNEDGPDWEIDPNRDFPADLKMERKYRKKYARGGATRTQGRPSKIGRKNDEEGEFLRSVEVQALVKFLQGKPNIALAFSFHSYGNVLFRPFGYMPDRPVIPKDDLKRLEDIGAAFARITGFKGFGAPYLGERQVVGGLHDYTYWMLGYPGYTLEIWGVPGVARDWADRGRRRDRNQDRGRDRRNRRRGETAASARKMLQYVDQEKIEDAYVEWKPYDHPTLGQVEIGGLWQPGRFRYNPPPSRIQKVVEPFVRFTLESARMTPLVRVTHLEVKVSKTRVRTVNAEVMNVGAAPTAWRLAEKRKLAKSARVCLTLPQGARLSSGRLERDIGALKPGQSERLRWTIVAPEGTDPTVASVAVISEKGGVHRLQAQIPPHIETQ